MAICQSKELSFGSGELLDAVQSVQETVVHLSKHGDPSPPIPAIEGDEGWVT